jgi:hypothetical protein
MGKRPPGRTLETVYMVKRPAEARRGQPGRTLETVYMGKRPAEATKDSHRKGHRKATGSKTKTKERGALFLPFYGIRAIDEPF